MKILLMTRVFISYSHDSEAHRAFVLQLANRLRADGLTCEIDQYINGFPPEGWQRWMETQIEQADFVLLVCTENYFKRYRGQDAMGGRGVNFEGLVISQTLYDAYYHNTKFIPVLPEGGSFDHVPLPLKQFSVFTLMRDYEALYRVLTAQPEVVVPELGTKKILPPKNGGNEPSIAKQEAAPVISASSSANSAYVNPDKQTMSDTMKAAWIGAFVVLLAALVTGIFSLYSGAFNLSTTPSVHQSITGGSGSNFHAGRDLIIDTDKQSEERP